jgi:hypothetical protein
MIVKIGLLLNLCVNSWLIKRKKEDYLLIVYYLVGIGIDALCLCSKLGWIYEGLLDEVYVGVSYLKLMQVALAGGLVLIVLVSVLAGMCKEIIELFCKNKRNSDNKNKSQKVVENIFAMGNKIVPENLCDPQNQLKHRNLISMKIKKPKFLKQ